MQPTSGGPAPGPLLELSGITKRYGDLVANDDVSLTVAPGEVVAMLGENGAGKSTLMKIVYGLVRPDAGTVTMDGQRLEIGSPRDAMAAGIGMVTQEFSLVDTMTVAENVALSGARPGPRRPRGRTPPGVRGDGADRRPARSRPARLHPLDRRAAAGGDRQGALPRLPGRSSSTSRPPCSPLRTCAPCSTPSAASPARASASCWSRTSCGRSPRSPTGSSCCGAVGWSAPASPARSTTSSWRR